MPRPQISGLGVVWNIGLIILGMIFNVESVSGISVQSQDRSKGRPVLMRTKSAFRIRKDELDRGNGPDERHLNPAMGIWGNLSAPKGRSLSSHEIELKTRRDIDRLDWGGSLGPFGPVEPSPWYRCHNTGQFSSRHRLSHSPKLFTNRVSSCRLRRPIVVSLRPSFSTGPVNVIGPLWLPAQRAGSGDPQ